MAQGLPFFFLSLWFRAFLLNKRADELNHAAAGRRLPCYSNSRKRRRREALKGQGEAVLWECVCGGLALGGARRGRVCVLLMVRSSVKWGSSECGMQDTQGGRYASRAGRGEADDVGMQVGIVYSLRFGHGKDFWAWWS